MAYTPGEFEYGLKAYDALDLSVETADILASRDVGLENFLRDQTTAIKTETDSLQTQISSIASAPSGWGGYTPVLRRGTTTVSTTALEGAYCFNAYQCFVNVELLVSGASNFPGNQTLSISLPVDADSTTRVLGSFMYNNRSATPFQAGLAFIESNTDDGDRAVFIVHNGNAWLGTTPNVTGDRNGDVFYMNLSYRVAV